MYAQLVIILRRCGIYPCILEIYCKGCLFSFPISYNVLWLYDVGQVRRIGAGVAEGKPRAKGPCGRSPKRRMARSVL